MKKSAIMLSTLLAAASFATVAHSATVLQKQLQIKQSATQSKAVTKLKVNQVNAAQVKMLNPQPLPPGPDKKMKLNINARAGAQAKMLNPQPLPPGPDDKKMKLNINARAGAQAKMLNPQPLPPGPDKAKLNASALKQQLKTQTSR
jgi:hypothetical protein